MFHAEPDGVFHAYDAKTGDELWRFQTGQLGLGGGAGPSGAAAMTYESRGEQFVALANNRAVWAFKVGGTVPPRDGAGAARRSRASGPDASPTPRPIQLGTVTTFTIASANRKIDWADDNGAEPVACPDQGRHAADVHEHVEGRATPSRPATDPGRSGRSSRASRRRSR